MKEDKTKRKTMMKDLLDDVKVTRRSFMKRASAATGTAVALGSLRPSLRALEAAGEGSSGGMGEWKATTCQGCTSWCSKQVYVVDGRAVKVRGNPNSKVKLKP